GVFAFITGGGGGLTDSCRFASDGRSTGSIGEPNGFADCINRGRISDEIMERISVKGWCS
ncbi:MAG: hypothetical protein ABJM44_13255, partial [Marinomonas sp.]